MCGFVGGCERERDYFDDLDIFEQLGRLKRLKNGCSTTRKGKSKRASLITASQIETGANISSLMARRSRSRSRFRTETFRWDFRFFAFVPTPFSFRETAAPPKKKSDGGTAHLDSRWVRQK